MKRRSLLWRGSLLACLSGSLGSHETGAAQLEAARLLRFPAVHGGTVVFSYASDLWVADRKGGPARRLTAHPGEEEHATISPDGSLVAFSASYDGNPDVYVLPVAGGAPRRLTWDALAETPIGWTPDGKIAYTSSAGNFTHRQQRLWLIAPAGGLPGETPLIEIGEGSFFPSGPGGPGKYRIAYNRTRTFAQNWRRYRGGNIGRISLYDFAANAYSELPNGGANSWYPMVAGDAIYFVSDRGEDGGGAANLYRHDLATGKETQLTRHEDADVKWPSTDGSTIVYELGGDLHAYDIATGKDETLAFEVRSDELFARPYLLKAGKKITSPSLAQNGRIAVEARGEIFSLAANGQDTRNLTGTPGIRESWPRWSADGATLAYLSDASGELQIHAQPAMGGPSRQLSRYEGPDSISGYSWSPDGERLAYWTEDGRLFLQDLKSGKATLVEKPVHGGYLTFDWSPDGRWIALTTPVATQFGAIRLYEIATGITTPVTDGFYDDSNVCFDLSGKYLFFSSARTFHPTVGRFEPSLKVEKADGIYVLPLTKDLPNPLFPRGEDPAASGADETGKKMEKAPTVRIDLEGLAGRAVALPVPGNEAGLTLTCATDGVFHYRDGKLHKFDLKERKDLTIYEGPEIETGFNPDRTKLAYFGGDTLGVADARPGVTLGAGKVETAAVEVWVDPQAQWRQMFWEAWRFERDNFFRADMGGLDWQAVGRYYERLLPSVRHWGDMTYVLSLMMSELGTSHAYVNDPPDETGLPDRAAGAAQLGADYERDGRWVRFKKVYRGTLHQESLRGPLGEPGVNVAAGDYLLEIDGRPVEASIHPNSLLINKANRVVTLTVNGRPDLTGARKIQVRPIESEAALRYFEWVEENRRKVDRMSGGRIGYIHYPNTSEAGQIEFIRGYFAQTDKDAIVFDARFNSGGQPQPMVLPTLARRRQALYMNRKWGADGAEIAAINGPKAMLINGYAGSGGDFTPWMFRDAGMGTLIGTRTLGGLVGIWNTRTLVDGTWVSAPSQVRFDIRTGEWIAENKGIAPDIEVDDRPDLIAQGHDPQLERAVAFLLDELKKSPPFVAEPQLPPARPRGPKID